MANSNHRFGLFTLAIVATTAVAVATVTALAHQTNPHAASAATEALSVVTRPQAQPTAFKEFARFLEGWTSMTPRGEGER